MNQRFVLLIMILSFSSVTIMAQDAEAEAMIEEIGQAISNGSARDMAAFFGQNVDLYLPRAIGTFSKSQSEIILREFFNRNRPKSYTVVNQGVSGDGSVFVIGRFTARSGQTYRSYFLLKHVSQSYLLHHVQFDQL